MSEDKEINEVHDQLNELANKKQENYSFANRDEYIRGLDSVLNKKHIQKRDIGNGKTQRYYASSVQKAVADFMFQEWNVIDVKPIPVKDNFITIQVKITFVPSYPGANEQFCSGIASILLNSSKNNLEYQLPAATSRAISDALKQKGNIFGRNLATLFNKNTIVPDDFSIRKNAEKKTPKPEQKKPSNETKAAIVPEVDDEDLPF
jgi:hypothetical protein